MNKRQTFMSNAKLVKYDRCSDIVLVFQAVIFRILNFEVRTLNFEIRTLNFEV